MSWDGIPEHRNLSGDDAERPKTPSGYRREIAAWLAGLPDPAPQSAAEYFREQAARLSPEPPQPQPGEMPPDPFDGIAAAAVAQAEIFRAMTAAGLTEPQALYYLACLVHVGRAMQEGHMLGPMPPDP